MKNIDIEKWKKNHKTYLHRQWCELVTIFEINWLHFPCRKSNQMCRSSDYSFTLIKNLLLPSAWLSENCWLLEELPHFYFHKPVHNFHTSLITNLLLMFITKTKKEPIKGKRIKLTFWFVSLKPTFELRREHSSNPRKEKYIEAWQ